MWPFSFKIFLKASSTELSLSTSIRTIVIGSFSFDVTSRSSPPRSGFRIPANTECPPRARVIAVARPIPVLVPVTTTMPILNILRPEKLPPRQERGKFICFKDFVSPQGLMALGGQTKSAGSISSFGCGPQQQSRPTGKSLNPVQPPRQKYFCFSEVANQVYIRSRPVPTEGRFAIVTECGAGCGGRGCADNEGAGSGRRSRVVLTPRRWRQVRGKQSTDDGGKQARSPGRARRKPLKPLRGECRAISGVT